MGFTATLLLAERKKTVMGFAANVISGGGIRYAVLDAFTDKPFCGNPAAVCLLEDDKDTQWMQKMATEFNITATAFLKKYSTNKHAKNDSATSQEYDLRWFSCFQEADICGHATLASAFFLFSYEEDCDLLFFHTLSGIITAKRIHKCEGSKSITDKFSVKITLPQASVFDCDRSVISLLHNTLQGFQVKDVKKTSLNDIIIELESGKVVQAIKPDFEEIRKCNARGVIITGSAPEQSEFDFSSRAFGLYGTNKDPVCGSVHCGLATFWRKKLGKSKLLAYQMSSRGGKLQLEVDSEQNTVSLQGDVVLVMSGVIATI